MSVASIPFKLTSAGIDAAFNLGEIDLNVTHVQLGDGNRTPNGSETALVSPQESATISGYFEVSAGQHRISSVVLGSGLSYEVSEIGLWSGAPGGGGSVLVFYWSQASGYIAVKSPSVNFNFENDIFFGGVVPGNITIVADTEFNALAMLADHEADPDAHPGFTTPPLGDDTTKPANTEWVNDTFGKILTKSVAGGANVTLTAVEGGHGILKFTGALTSSINVSIPATPTRSWIVENATTGNFTLTTKTPSGAGVVIKQGKRAFILSDGTDISLVLDFSVSLASSGYQKLPSGLILQWGTNASGSTNGTITFPIAFTVDCFSVFPVNNNPAVTTATADPVHVQTIDDPTATQFKWQATNSNTNVLATPGDFSWFAIGY